MSGKLMRAAWLCAWLLATGCPGTTVNSQGDGMTPDAGPPSGDGPAPADLAQAPDGGTQAGGKWVPLGPSGGSPLQMAVSGAGTIFVTTALSGMWRSTDGGATWREIGQGMGGTGTAVYVATGPGSDVYAVAPPILFRSGDSGDTWQVVRWNGGGGVGPIAVTESGAVLITESGNTLRSTDRGATFTASAAPSVSPNAVRSKGKTVLIPHDKGLLRSADDGVTFTESSRGLPSMLRNTDVAFAGSNVLCATLLSGVYVSADDGMTWTKTVALTGNYATIAGSAAGDFWAGSGGGLGLLHSTDGGNTAQKTTKTLDLPSFPMIQALAPRPPAELVAGLYGGAGVYKTSDSGATWTAATGNLSALSIGSLVVKIGNGATSPSGDLYTADGQGMHRSTDSGATWALLGGATGPAGFSSLLVDDKGTLIAYDGLNGVVTRSTDNGATWVKGMKVLNVRSLVAKPGFLFAFDGASEVLRSTDAGATFTTASTFGVVDFVTGITLAGNGDLLATSGAGATKLFRSTDNGATFTKATFPGAGGPAGLVQGPGSKMYAPAGLSIYRSDDNGANWTACGAVKSGTLLILGTMLVAGDGTVFVSASTTGDAFSKTPPVRTVYSSSDSCATWTENASGLLSTGLMSGATNKDGVFFAGTYAGVHRYGP